MQTPEPRRAVVVFGTAWNKEAARFPEFVYREIDKAVEFFLRGLADHIIVCGSHHLKDSDTMPPLEKRAAFRMRRHILMRYGHLEQFSNANVVLLEDQSISIPDNWAQLKRRYPSLEAVYLVTIRPLLPRIRYFGEFVYDHAIAITYTALPVSSSSFPDEDRILEESICMTKDLPCGNYFLLDADDSSLWPAIREHHHKTCPTHRHLHTAVAIVEGN